MTNAVEFPDINVGTTVTDLQQSGLEDKLGNVQMRVSNAKT